MKLKCVLCLSGQTTASHYKHFGGCSEVATLQWTCSNFLTLITAQFIVYPFQFWKWTSFSVSNREWQMEPRTFLHLENDSNNSQLSDCRLLAKSATLAGRCRPGSVQSLRPGVQMSEQDGSWIPVDLLPTRLRHFWSSPPAIGWPWSSRLPTCATCFVRRTFICIRRPFKLELTSCSP